MNRQPPIGIGHNRPPEEIDQPDEFKQLQPALLELGTELRKAAPEISLVKRWATSVRNVLIVTGKWSWELLNVGIKAGAAAAGAKIGADHAGDLVNAFQAIVNWLEIAAKTVF